MSTDKDGTQAEELVKHYHEQFGQAGWDVVRSNDSEVHIVAYCYKEADADGIIADHRKAAQADALAVALRVADSLVRLASTFLAGSDDYDSWLEEVAAWDEHFSPRTSALASFASNPSEAGA